MINDLISLFNDLKFVINHSEFRFLGPAFFGLLGLWWGYETWAKWKESLQVHLKEQAELKKEIAKFNPKQGLVSSLASSTIGRVGSFGEPSTSKIPVFSIFRGEDELIDVDEKLGIIYLKPPQKVDNLTEISGIDTDTAARFKKAGIYTFKQLASLDEIKRKNVRESFGDFNWEELMEKIVGPEYIYHPHSYVNLS